MKFRDPKTGRVYDHISEAWFAWKCEKESTCETGSEQQRSCPLAKTACRPLWCDDHPAEAAQLMGYEIIEED